MCEPSQTKHSSHKERKRKKSTMDMYLKSKQGEASTAILEPHKEQSHEKSDIMEVSQSVLDKILVAVQPIEDMNSKLDNLINDIGGLETNG